MVSVEGIHEKKLEKNSQRRWSIVKKEDFILILGHGAAMQMDDSPVLIKWRGCNSIRRQEYIKTFFFFFSHTLIQVGYLDPTSELDLAHFYTHDWISTDFPQIIEHLVKKHIYTTVNQKKQWQTDETSK